MKWKCWHDSKNCDECTLRNQCGVCDEPLHHVTVEVNG